MAKLPSRRRWVVVKGSVSFILRCAYVMDSAAVETLIGTTLFFSRSTPNLANVIHTMDIISDCLTAKTNDPTISPAMQSALGLAKKALNCYYSRTDDSEALYRIATSKCNHYFFLLLSLLIFRPVLHPQYKLEYFKGANR